MATPSSDSQVSTGMRSRERNAADVCSSSSRASAGTAQACVTKNLPGERNRYSARTAICFSEHFARLFGKHLQGGVEGHGLSRNRVI